MTRKLHNPKAYTPSVYIPCWLIQVASSVLSHQAKLLYGRLSMWSNENGKVFRSVFQLSIELGCSKSTIDRTIKELKDANLIGTFHPFKGGINHFEFYDHPWMHEPIKEQLSYKSNHIEAPSDVTLPTVINDVTPTSEVTHININKIKTNNNNNNIRALDKNLDEESLNLVARENENNENILKYGQDNNQTLPNSKAKKDLDGIDSTTKSDYHNNQTKKCTIKSKIHQYDLNNMLEFNPFQIPTEMLQDYITNRNKKRVPITFTSWNKINKELSKCKERDIDPHEAFETMVASGWQSMKVEWLTPHSHKKSNSTDAFNAFMQNDKNKGDTYDQYGNVYDPFR